MIQAKEITWGDGGKSPFRGDMSDFDWKNVSEVRVGYTDDSFEWIRFIRIINGYMVLHAKTSKGVVETCPEDIWGIRFKHT